MARTAL
ncbi:hypothetical protein AZE42_12782, partial [Rhizopogon vesiculosus]